MISTESYCEEKKVKRFKTVVFFTLSVSNTNSVLSHSTQWINEFARHCEKLHCYPVHMEKNVNLSENVQCSELGGGSFLYRCRAIFRILNTLKVILRNRDKAVVVYHMFPAPAILIGAILKLARVPQILWYSHSSTKNGLRLASRFVDHIFTPTRNSFPLKLPEKVKVVGHGIEVGTFQPKNLEDLQMSRKDGIWVFGRISPIKRIDVLIEAINRATISIKVLTCVGPIYDTKYFEFIKTLANNSHIEFHHKRELEKAELAEVMLSSSITFTGSLRTLDKAAIEAALAGSFILSDEREVLDSTGMSALWGEMGFAEPPMLHTQIELLDNLACSNAAGLQRLTISVFNAKSHSLETLVENILRLGARV
jgi:glycosyltransferase involved in cell wall biosynthesis